MSVQKTKKRKHSDDEEQDELDLIVENTDSLPVCLCEANSALKPNLLLNTCGLHFQLLCTQCNKPAKWPVPDLTEVKIAHQEKTFQYFAGIAIDIYENLFHPADVRHRDSDSESESGSDDDAHGSESSS